MRTISGELFAQKVHGISGRMVIRRGFSGVGLTKYGFALITTFLMITGTDFVLVMLTFQN